MAYASLISLKRSVEQILLHPPSPDQHYFIPCEKQCLESLREKLGFLKQFLEEFPSHESDENIENLEARIRDAAYEAQDILDLHQVHSQEKKKVEIGDYAMKLRNGDLNKIVQEIDSIVQEIQPIMKQGKLQQLDDDYAQPWDSLRAKFSSDGNDLMVGFDDQLMQIRDLLTGQPSALRVISIVGMGGIGKTTLATNAYNDPYIVNHFDIHGWVTVSQSYSIRKLMLAVLDSMKQLTIGMHQQSDDQLGLHLYHILKGYRYLVIIDDIWDTQAWDDVKRMFPDENNGSRIVFTTRLTDVAAYASEVDHIYEMPLLSDDNSWILLRAKIFGSQIKSCPPYLEEIAMNIARKCQGLPLLIVVIGGLLSKVNMTHEAWRAVAENITSFVSSSSDICSQILKMSYIHLPQHLKACFLYMGTFPEDSDISVSKLKKLWVAEGFIEHVCDQNFEDMAESYLQELNDRSLISMSRRKLGGKIKKCRIHDLLLDLCVREACREKFLQVTKIDADLFLGASIGQRRLSIHSIEKFKLHRLRFDFKHSSSFVQSLIICAEINDFPSIVLARFKLLKVLDAIKVKFHHFPHEVFELLHLRYISLTCDGEIPASLSKLCNLQTLIIKQVSLSNSASYITLEVWKMRQLRHIQHEYGYLLIPNAIEFDKYGGHVVLEKLQTLSGIWNLRLTKELLQRIPNIRKLGVSYDATTCSKFEFENLANLRQLKKLKINIKPQIPWSTNLCRRQKLRFDFPDSLQSLTLSGCGISWNALSIVGSLPHLEIPKLKNGACVGKEWKPNEGNFCQLKLLLLDELDLMHLNAKDYHFPALEHLILRLCKNFLEIPIGMGESATLTMIELHQCKNRVLASAMKIQELQRDNGNDCFQVVNKLI